MTTVIILAGGRGTRLLPLHSSVPKPLTDVNGRPCLDYIVDNLIVSGFTEIVLSLCHFVDPLIEYAKKRKLGYQIQPVNRGTARAMKKLAHLVSDPFIVCNGDTITNVNLKEMLQEHIKAKLEVTIYSPHGSDIMHNGGNYIFNKSVLKLIPDTFMDIPTLLDKIKTVQIYNPDNTFYFDIGTPDKLEKARQALKH